MEIKKGDVFICRSDVRMQDDNELVYRKGIMYRSEQDESITNDSGYKAHYWQGVEWEKWFKKFNHKMNDLKLVDIDKIILEQ